MQRIVSTSAGETLTIEVERGGTRVTLKAVPALKEVKDSFGNVHRMGVLGISRSIAPTDLKMEPVSPPMAVWLGVKETWTIVETTLSYVGRIIVGRDNAGANVGVLPCRGDAAGRIKSAYSGAPSSGARQSHPATEVCDQARTATGSGP